MLTGELRGQIDSIWNDFWSGGLANPLQVIEQIAPCGKPRESIRTAPGMMLERFQDGRNCLGVPTELMECFMGRRHEGRRRWVGGRVRATRRICGTG